MDLIRKKNILILVPSGYCPDICKNHCTLRMAGLKKENLTCSVLCSYLSADKEKCDQTCQPKTLDLRQIESNITKPLFDEGCAGYGTESCYKRCRLQLKKSIQICKCACCKCLF